MAEYKSTYQRNPSITREDPRLSRRETKSPAKAKSPTLALPDPNWQNQNNQYTRPPLQTSYQHLQPTMSYDPTQYSTQGYQNAYPGYQAYGNTAYAYEGYGQPQVNYVGTGSGTIQPGPPGEEYPQAAWAPVAGYVNNQTQVTAALDTKNSQSSGTVKVDAVAQEMKHQKAELSKQREEYERRIGVLRRELELLRRQKHELMQDHTSDRDTELILRENGKLQVEIQNKLKDAYNVIEILTGIIGDGSKFKEDEASKKDKRSVSVVDPNENKYNYVHYDPELHWCRMCDVFPKTAKDLLMHLHSKEHRDMMQEENVEIPWHKLPPEPEFPFIDGATKKRLPIKGLQFFVSSTAWYCRLCDSWIGDLHCASQHLKSVKHSQNYSNFVEQNPHWEIEWLKDRERALERIKKSGRSSDSEEHDKKKKRQRKDKYSPSSSNGKDKKRKKRSKKRRKDSSDSSSSSSSSGSSSDDEKKDTSKSIHVAMRNKMKLQAQMLLNEELGGKWEALGRLVEEHKLRDSSQTKDVVVKAPEPEDTLINQWMSVKQPQDKDKVMLDNLKDRLKQKQAEKNKVAELDRKRREKEREEQELKEKEEAKQALEKEKARQKQREDMERLKEIREQVKFKPKEKYRRRKSPSNSPENTRKKSRSPSAERRKPTPDKYRRHENGQYSDKNRDDSPGRKYKSHRSDRQESSRSDKKPPPPPSYKKLPFIGRMPLFKNKKSEDKVEKEIKKEDYDIPRQTRFQPGNLARAFIPEPEVVCFPKLSCYPPLSAPIPPPPMINKKPPAPPKISEPVPKAPPPPKINEKVAETKKEKTEKELEEIEKQESKTIEDFINQQMEEDENPLNDYHEPFGFSSYSYGNVDYNMMYPPHPPMFDFTQDPENGGDASSSVPLSHTMPLQPPPLPPDDPNDDLALLGISSDDLAAQLFK